MVGTLGNREKWNTLKIRHESRNGSRNGQGGIRTLDTLAGMPPFQGGAFNHSATCPEVLSGGNLAVLEGEVNVRKDS
jgi:hypothetical protein